MTLKELEAAETQALKAWVKIAMYRHLTDAEKAVCPEYQAMLEATRAFETAKREQKHK